MLLAFPALLSPVLRYRSFALQRSFSMVGTQTVRTSDRLKRLRELMKASPNSVDAYLVPSEDQHASEYISTCDERRAFISGFDGSAGTVIVTQSEAFLITDGRYFLQAEKQLDENWTLLKYGLPDVPTWQEFLSKNLPDSSRIGIDATLVTADDASTVTKDLTSKQSSLVALEENLVDIVWGEDRPSRPKNPIFHLSEKYSGESHISKLARLRAELSKAKHKAVVLTALDEIAWLFNLRGSDIAYNPVFFAYCVVTLDSAVLFVQNGALQNPGLLGDEVAVKEYGQIWSYLKGLAYGIQKEGEKILLPKKSSLAVANAIGENYTMGPSPVSLLKAIKNETEMEGFRQCHIRDGAALVQYFSWLEEELNKGTTISEYQGSEKLESFRAQQALFQGLSFPTISSTGPNAAIIHYDPDKDNCDIIRKDQIYLCDSGAQFLDGTTDTTRTWHFANPSEEEKRAFTRVLQGHIAIDMAVFPNGTTGYIIDSWARAPLWRDGLDFRHGTGHGVGHFLNVHEGPHGIGLRIAYNATPLKAGMTVSNEPGYYEDGKFGIRIENIVLVRDAKTPSNFGEKGYLRMERVTMCPIQTKLVEKSLLSAEEVSWLNGYHKEVWDKVSPLLANDTRALSWLKRECSPI